MTDATDQTLPATPPPPFTRMGAGRPRYVGLPRDAWRDAYHIMLTLPVGAFLGVLAIVYLCVNALFAGLYMLDPGGIANTRPGSFTDAFFFSVQTLGGLGYGVMAPKSLYTNLVSMCEVFLGLLNLGIATGLLFARISKPTARIMFSQRAVITPLNGKQTLIFRAANRRRNLVIEAEVTVTLIRNVTTGEGMGLRRFHELSMMRSRTPLFFMTWQVMHVVDEASPLWGETTESLLASQAEILVVMKGLDETFASTIHARMSYAPDEIIWGGRLADIFTTNDAGERFIDFRRFHEVIDT